MAIIIPSDKIYQVTNEKVNKNKIDKIDINVKRISFEKQEQGQLVQKQETPTVNVLPQDTEIDVLANSDFQGTYMGKYTVKLSLYVYSNYFVFALNKTYYQDITISFDKASVQNLVSVDGKIYANISVSYNVKRPTAKVTLSKTNDSEIYNPKYYISKFALSPDSTTVGTPTNEQIPTTITKKYSGYDWVSDNSVQIVQNEGQQKVELKENGNYYTATARILCGAVQGTCEYVNHQYNNFQDQMYKEFECTQYVPYTITISVEGQVTKFNVEDAIVTVGEPYSKNSLQIQGNELIQEKNSWGGADSNTLGTQNLYTNVLNKYSHGKETAIIKCSFGEYFDENNKLAIGYNITKGEIVVLSDVYSDINIGGVYWTNYGNGQVSAVGKSENRSVRTIYTNPDASLEPFELLFSGISDGGTDKYGIDIYVYNSKGIAEKYVLTDGILTVTDCYGISQIDLWVAPEFTAQGVLFTPKARTIINSLPPYFKVGDIVIPQKYAITNEGLKDVPMSLNSLGNPKTFIVIGVNFIYDGASWQELILEEYEQLILEEE